jgi:hypothetical protein
LLYSLPYGLKNALPTFVCVMHKTFRNFIRDIIEVYVDDIVVKIKSRIFLLDNLTLVFDRLRSTRMKFVTSQPLRVWRSLLLIAT